MAVYVVYNSAVRAFGLSEFRTLFQMRRKFRLKSGRRFVIICTRLSEEFSVILSINVYRRRFEISARYRLNVPNFRFINGDNKRPFGSMLLRSSALKFIEKRV